MAIVIAGHTSAIQPSGQEISIPVPSETQEGDLLVVFHSDQSQGTDTYTGNAAFTHEGPAYVARSPEGRIIGIWTRWATGSEPSSYVFQRTGGPTRSTAHMVALRGVDSNYLVDVVTEYHGHWNGSVKMTESLSASVPGLQFFFGRNECVAEVSHVPTTTPDGFTELSNIQTSETISVSRTASWLGYREVPAGETGESGIAWSAGAGTSAQSIVFRPAADEEPTPPGIRIGTINGKGAYLTYINGVGERVTPASLKLLGQAYNLAQMDADIANGVTVYWAHRGFSNNYSEMTQYAYDRAVQDGAKALEFSMRRTSDGVYYGMHDNTLDRVTNLSGATSSVTWAELEGTAVTAPTPGGYVTRLEDFINRYQRQLLIIDPKSGQYINDEVVPLLQSFPDWQNRFLIKLDGMHNLTVWQAYKNAGFKTAGYWYPNESSLAALAARAEYVDYIGMQYDATTDQWNEVFSYGKPVWGHVLYNTGQKNAALAAGCHILQCGEKTLLP